MTAPSRRLVRRSKQLPQRPFRRALVAASAPVKDASKAFSKGMSGRRNNWQNEAWEFSRTIGELRYYVGWRASSCSRVRLVASEIDPETGVPTGNVDPDNAEGQRFVEIVRQIAGGRHGQAQLQKRTAECLTVPGELWHVIVNTTDPLTQKPVQRWYPVSKSEFKATASTTTIVLPTGEEYKLGPNDVLYHVWEPDPEKAAEPNSPVRAVLDSLGEIRRTTKTIANASKSRLIGNGIVFVPNQMSLPTLDAPVSSDKPGDPIAPLIGTPAVQQLQELLFQVATTAYDDEDSLAALIPMFAAVDAEHIKDVVHLKFDNEVTEVAIKTRNDAIARLAMGLDVSPERLLGLGTNSNHWSAWQIADEDVRLHIAPVMETLCHAIYNQVLRAVLVTENIDPDKYILWYDASELTADPDKTEEATNAFDRGAITADAYREFLGLGDAGYDLLNGGLEEWQRWATDVIAAKPEMLLKLMPLLDPQLQALDFPQPAIESEDEGADDDSNPGDEETDGEEEPATESQQASMRPLSLGVGDVHGMAVDMLVSRALEISGAKRRSRAGRSADVRAQLADVSNMNLHRVLPAVDPAAVPELIQGWDSILNEAQLRLAGINPDVVRASVLRLATAALTAKTIDGEVI